MEVMYKSSQVKQTGQCHHCKVHASVQNESSTILLLNQSILSYGQASHIGRANSGSQRTKKIRTPVIFSSCIKTQRCIRSRLSLRTVRFSNLRCRVSSGWSSYLHLHSDQRSIRLSYPLDLTLLICPVQTLIQTMPESGDIKSIRHIYILHLGEVVPDCPSQLRLVSIAMMS